MTLKEVTEEIVSNANLEALSIIARARDTVEEQEKKTKIEIEEYRKNVNEKTKNFLLSFEQQELANARAEARKRVLKAKQELVDEVIESTKENLVNLDKKRKTVFLEKLKKLAENEIKVERILVNKSDKALLKVKEVVEGSLMGGLIAENKDGTIRLDLSLNELIESQKQDLIVKICERLFSK